MRRILYQLPVIAVLCLLSLAVVGRPDIAVVKAADVPSLTISQLKITSSNGQFILLHNATDGELDMAAYQLEYFNHYDVSKATSSRLVALSGVVPPHGYYMVNDSALRLCQQLTVNSVSLGFSSTAGMVQLRSLQQSGPGGAVSTVLQDYVGWSKAAAIGAQTLPTNAEASLIRTVHDQYTAAVSLPGEGSWQAVRPADDNPCALVSVTDPTTVVLTDPSQLLTGEEPPATILQIDGAENVISIPAANIGLKAATITELLPNPDGTGNDATDEFIELHNSNPTAFDLSGYSIQVGLTTLRTYVFPAGSVLAPQSFKAFYAAETKLSLSNSGSQVKLLDSAGSSIATSEVYGTAKDGQAWALGQGKWRWTTTVTPGFTNIIREPVSKKTAAKSTSKKTTKGTATLPKKLASGQSAAVGAGFQDEPIVTPIHVKTLALIGGVALLYGAYEYRRDMANRVYLLRRYLGDRWRHRPQAPWRRSD